jgi:citrate lyase subunit beta/citryl-CoA lyase
VNSLATGFTEEDLEWVVSPDLTGIVLAKTESEDDIAKVDQILSRIEAEKGIASGTIRLLPLLESAKGILNASQIANAPRNIGLAFGALDYSIDLGVMLSEGGDEIHLPRSIVALVARAFDKIAIDTPWFDIDDKAGMARDASIARNLGFQGKLLIHPSQIRTANEVFSPTNAEIEYSIKVINAFEEAEMSGIGAVSLEGKMIDAANYRQAKNIIALTEEIAMNIR